MIVELIRVLFGDYGIKDSQELAFSLTLDRFSRRLVYCPIICLSIWLSCLLCSLYQFLLQIIDANSKFIVICNLDFQLLLDLLRSAVVFLSYLDELFFLLPHNIDLAS